MDHLNLYRFNKREFTYLYVVSGKNPNRGGFFQVFRKRIVINSQKNLTYSILYTTINITISYVKIYDKEDRKIMIKQPDFSNLIRDLREITGLSQEKFAAKIGVSFATVNRWEKGHSNPSPLAIEKVQGMLKRMSEKGRELWKKYFSE
jgi:DNA-binding transcriptional regulator YiaG